MTFYSSTCGDCGAHCEWAPHKVGGKWIHHVDRNGIFHADHDPVVDWEPVQVRNAYGDWTTQ